MGAEPGSELPRALPDLALAVGAQMCIAASRCAGGEEGWAASLGRPWEEDGMGSTRAGTCPFLLKGGTVMKIIEQEV